MDILKSLNRMEINSLRNEINSFIKTNDKYDDAKISFKIKTIKDRKEYQVKFIYVNPFWDSATHVRNIVVAKNHYDNLSDIVLIDKLQMYINGKLKNTTIEDFVNFAFNK